MAPSTIVTYSKAVGQFETFVSEPRAGGRGEWPTCETNWSETCPDGPDVPLVPGRSG